MNRIIFILLLLILPSVSLAAASPDLFTVPATDYSLIFLGQIFGSMGDFLVGSKNILSELFKVFNTAVLTLGGIVVLYTIVVGTLNTAGEGEALGRQWSSVWIPIRSALGISLLLPQQSGYSLIQVFMMWVIVQGIGAADTLWDKALDGFGAGEGVYTAVTPNVATYIGPSGKVLKQLLCAATIANYVNALPVMQGQSIMRSYQYVGDTFIFQS